MRRWHRITLALLVVLPVVALSVYFLTNGDLVWTLVAVGGGLAIIAIEFVVQGEKTDIDGSRLGFLFREVKTMREASILAAFAYPVGVAVLVLLGGGWLSALLIPLGAVGGLLLGQRVRLGAKKEKRSDIPSIRGPGWHPHPDHPEWWFYWDGSTWTGTPQRRSVD